MDNLLQEGVKAYRAGNHNEARKFFIAAVKQSQNDERAWGWMYNVCDNDKERTHCLRQILRINPKNEKAKQMLDTLIGQDSPFELTQIELTQKIIPPTQEQKNTSSLDIQIEKSAEFQKTPVPKKKSSALIGAIAIIFFLWVLYFMFSPNLKCNQVAEYVYYCSATGLVTSDKKLESAMRNFCDRNNLRSCLIETWANENDVPTSRATDLEESTIIAQYVRNQFTNHDCFYSVQNGEIVNSNCGDPP